MSENGFESEAEKVREIIKEQQKAEINLNDLANMIENPSKYFEEHPIKEDWQDPPEVPSFEYVEKILSKGTIQEKEKLYAILSAVRHFAKRKTHEHKDFKKVTRFEIFEELEKKIAKAFRALGWEVQTQEDMRSGKYREYKDTCLHFGIGEGLCMHEIPRHSDHNVSVSKYVFNSEGQPVTYEEFLNNFRKDQPVKAVSENDLKDFDTTQRKMIKEFLQSELLNMNDIKSIEEYEDVLSIDTFSRSYEMMKSEKAAEKKAFQMIDDDDEIKYFFTEKVKSEGYEGSLKDFKQLVKDDGWYYQLCGYDHKYQTTKSGFVYWRRD